MANLTEQLDAKLQSIAHKLTRGNSDDAQDCLQEARLKVLEMEDGQTESYYAEYGMRAMQMFLRTENSYKNRTTSRGTELKDYIHVAPWLSQSGDVDTMDRGRQSPTAIELNELKGDCCEGDRRWGEHE